MALILLVTLLPGVAAARPGDIADRTGPLGTNLGFVVDWSDEKPFVDHMKLSRSWLTQCTPSDPGCDEYEWDTGEQHLLDLDSRGWVRSLPDPADSPRFTRVSSVVVLGREEVRTGRYVVTYSGEGTIEYDLGTFKIEAESRPGRDVVEILPGDTMGYLTITSTDPAGTGDHLRDIRWVREELAGVRDSHWFDPRFLDRLAPFRTIRFQNWMAANDDPPGSWRLRPRVNETRWSRSGVPVEVMVDLANRTGAEPWFTLPHAADDRYVRSFARIVRDRLAADRRIYVELSNEVWNSLFAPQHDWAQMSGLAMWPDADPFQALINFYALRTTQVCDRFRAVFGTEADRITCVGSGWAAIPWVSEQILDCPLVGGPSCVRRGIDVLAVAPYFGGSLGDAANVPQVEGWLDDPDGGLSRLFREVRFGGELTGVEAHPEGELPAAIGWMNDSGRIARARNVPMVAYEGGQHMVVWFTDDDSAGVTALFQEANRDPRMGAVYADYLDAWRAAGGELFVNFLLAESPSRWGSWGILEHIAQDTSPKWEAVTGFGRANPCWWDGCEVPATRVCRGRAATIVGGAGADRLVGRRANDVIWAGPGDDIVSGRRGNDILCLGPGSDRGRGGMGRDRLFGHSGNDVLRGGTGRDLAVGGRGRDRCAAEMERGCLA